MRSQPALVARTGPLKYHLPAGPAPPRPTVGHGHGLSRHLLCSAAVAPVRSSLDACCPAARAPSSLRLSPAPPRRLWSILWFAVAPAALPRRLRTLFRTQRNMPELAVPVDQPWSRLHSLCFARSKELAALRLSLQKLSTSYSETLADLLSIRCQAAVGNGTAQHIQDRAKHQQSYILIYFVCQICLIIPMFY